MESGLLVGGLHRSMICQGTRLGSFSIWNYGGLVTKSVTCFFVAQAQARTF
jgi:hypothetical protein